jgi:hypothetical protein
LNDARRYHPCRDRATAAPRRLLSVLAAALVLSACTGGPPTTSRSTPSGPESTSSGTADASTPPATAVPAAPPPAACYRLTSEQLTRPTNESAPVPCAGPHTAATIHVGRLDTVVDGHSVAVDSAAVQRQLSTTCPRKLAAYVGGSAETRSLSRVNVVWFSPTLEQSDQGADWFRCDLIVFATADALLPLPPTRRLDGMLDRAGALRSYGLCGTAAPGARDFERVVCSRRHSWRAIDTIPLAGGTAYPGVTVVRRAGNTTCRDLARSRAGSTLRFQYGWEWPTREQWARGQHFGYCWVPG